jgi:S1-C subfamily serine protease
MLEFKWSTQQTRLVCLQGNDLILRVGGDEVRNFIAFKRRLIGLQPGEVLNLTLLRDGQKIELTSALGFRPS